MNLRDALALFYPIHGISAETSSVEQQLRQVPAGITKGTAQYLGADWQGILTLFVPRFPTLYYRVVCAPSAPAQLTRCPARNHAVQFT